MYGILDSIVQFDITMSVYDLAVVLRAEERVIGSCTLALLDYEPRHATFLYRFNRRSWRSGYATEAMRAV
ncbi:GNAT family N-acetyltransferase [Roseiflexus castenholzii]|uniref:GNAT family N-acetyltransferase n=1 Tax=Roseiflexus castenholzii TaxID=120962 RepID=UPI003C7E028A